MRFFTNLEIFSRSKYLSKRVSEPDEPRLFKFFGVFQGLEGFMQRPGCNANIILAIDLGATEISLFGTFGAFQKRRFPDDS